MKVKNFQDTIAWYDQNAKQYAEGTYVVAPDDLIDQFMHLFPDNPKVLDAGCGGGRDTRLLAAKGADVTGLDISQGLLEEARKRNPELAFVHGNFLNIPFDDEFFNGVWAHAALVHLETINDVKKSLNEFHRVLKTKGILHLFVKEQMGEEKTEIVKDTLSNHERFFRYYSEDEMKKYLHEASFKILDFKTNQDPLGRKEIRWICIFAEK